jgi:hypothetical protein
LRTRENGEGLGSSTGKKNDSGLVALLRIEGATAGAAAGLDADRFKILKRPIGAEVPRSPQAPVTPASYRAPQR